MWNRIHGWLGLGNDQGQSFQDRVAVVTGATSGIGRELCRALGERGALVVATGRSKTRADAVAREIIKAGGRAQAARLDVRRSVDFRRVIDAALNRHGRLDYLFNNAGALAVGDSALLDLRHWEDVVEINLGGVLTGSKLAYDVMVKQGFGHIVNVASQAALIPVPGFVAYAASKHGVMGLSLSLRMEAARRGVQVSVVCPGYVRSEILDKAVKADTDREQLDRMMTFKPWDTRRAVDFILSGVAKNDAVIVFPEYTRLIWLVYRYLPQLYYLSARFTTGEFAKRTAG